MMIRQAAFCGDRNKPMYKGGLHCHTTRSDGAGDPAEVIRLHKANGYDFLAITDHRYYNYKNFAPDVEMTILPGMEYDGGGFGTIADNDEPFFDAHGFRCFHTVCIGGTKEDGNGFDQDERIDSAYFRCQTAFQPYLDMLHEKGQMTIYCHPEWSSTPARYFSKLKGNFAMEIWNTGCAMEDDMDTDAAYWDELLGQGVRIFGVATDDGHAMYQHCGGWVRVAAKENTVPAIREALADGAFYSSCGPEIYDFYYEDGKVVVECSDAAKIRLHCDKHPTRIVRSAEGNLTRAEFKIDTYAYVRVTVIDKHGKYAWTNPIFLRN